MSTTTFPTVPLRSGETNYLTVNSTLRGWLLTTDHKRIALLYLATITTLFAVGGAAAGAIRIHLLTPSGLLFGPETYDRLFTLHGIVMVFFFLIPSIPTTLGNFVLPLMVGAKDLAYPRLNLTSWYLFLVGALFGLWALVTGGVDTGWTFYTPFSSEYSTSQVTPVVLGLVIVGASSILTGLNFIVTIHMLRAPGLTWWRLPVFVWSLYTTSVIIVLATPVLALAFLMIVVERALGVGIFDPRLGGDPLLFQHLFWFYSHPAVYIMLLPGMGVVTEVITCFARKMLFGYRWVAVASVAIGVLGFLVWGHHMFVAGMSTPAALMFSLLSFLVAIPSAIKVFNWTATLYRGSIALDTPMLYALGFIGLFVVGGLTGLWLSTLASDVHLHDTYFVIAHFHYIMVGGAVMAFFGGMHYWWPKITGRLYPQFWGRIAATTIFFGFNLTFFPQFLLGYMGMPRRYAVYPPEFQILHIVSTMGAGVLAIGYTLPLIYLVASLFGSTEAGPNPWGATGLEWQTPSPPPSYNFAETPIVVAPPYQYHELYEVPQGSGEETGAPR